MFNLRDDLYSFLFLIWSEQLLPSDVYIFRKFPVGVVNKALRLTVLFISQTPRIDC